MLLADRFIFRAAENGLGQAATDLNDSIDGLLGPVVDNSPLNQLVSTGNDEEPPFTSEPDNAGIFDPTGFVFDLFG
jgi:hypothetical protein